MINLENIGAKSHDKIIISQTFGRETGFICGAIRYWDKSRKLPIMLLMPEDKRNFSEILLFAKKQIKKFGRVMIFLSEGYNLIILLQNMTRVVRLCMGQVEHQVFRFYLIS